MECIRLRRLRWWIAAVTFSAGRTIRRDRTGRVLRLHHSVNTTRQVRTTMSGQSQTSFIFSLVWCRLPTLQSSYMSTRKMQKAYRKKPCDQSRSARERQFSSQEPFQQKLVAYWTATIDACGSNSKVLWSKLRLLLQPHSDGATTLSADNFAHYSAAKTGRICALIVSTPSSTIKQSTSHSLIWRLWQLTKWWKYLKNRQLSSVNYRRSCTYLACQACQSCPSSSHHCSCSLQRVVPATHIFMPLQEWHCSTTAKEAHVGL